MTLAPRQCRGNILPQYCATLSQIRMTMSVLTYTSNVNGPVDVEIIGETERSPVA
jgi:hypothetical protein